MPGGYLGININAELDGRKSVLLTSTVSPSAPMHYGPQPPGLNSPCSLFLMFDKSDLGRGPAYFFEQQFDKIVIVDDDVFSGGGSKRWLNEDGNYQDWAQVEERGYSRDEKPIIAGAKPWYCFWNSTVLEGFIYLDQNTTAANTSLTPGPSSPSAPASISGHPGASIASAAIASTLPSNIPRHQNRDSSPSSSSPPPYPKVIKIEERRNSGSNVQPYCQQMQILDSMVPAPASDPDGNPFIVNLTESELTADGAVQGHSSSRRRAPDWWAHHDRRQASLGSSCYCEWVSE